jgi:hypothetical protein
MPVGLVAVLVVFGGTKGGVPTFVLEPVGLTTEVIGEVGNLETGVLGDPVILSITAFVAAPKAAPVKAVPNLLVVPLDFVTVGFAIGVTDVLVAGVVAVVLAIAGFAVVAVVLDVSAGFAAIAGFAVVAVVLDAAGVLDIAVLEETEGLANVAAGLVPIGLVVTPARVPPNPVLGANALVVVDVIGREATPPRGFCLPPPTPPAKGCLPPPTPLADGCRPRASPPKDGCLPSPTPPKDESSPLITEVIGPVDRLPRSRIPLGLRISRPRSPASKFTNGS